jgi:MFS transporter, SP family, general alpha glucoside:H+ symporter
MSDTKQEGIIADSRPADEVSDEKVLIAEAAAGFANERELGPLAALKAYPWAIVWSLVMALCVIMEGYDTALLGSFSHTVCSPNSSSVSLLIVMFVFSIVPNQIWPLCRSHAVYTQRISAHGSMAIWGEPVNQCWRLYRTILNGWLVTAFGQRRVVLWSLIILMGLIFLPFFAPIRALIFRTAL